MVLMPRTGVTYMSCKNLLFKLRNVLFECRMKCAGLIVVPTNCCVRTLSIGKQIGRMQSTALFTFERWHRRACPSLLSFTFLSSKAGRISSLVNFDIFVIFDSCLQSNRLNLNHQPVKRQYRNSPGSTNGWSYCAEPSALCSGAARLPFI